MSSHTPIRGTLIVLVGLLLTLLGGAPAQAQEGLASTYDFRGEVMPDGVLRAVETITLADAPDELVQRLALVTPIDRHRARVYDITDVQVTVDGADAGASVTRDGSYLVIRVPTSGIGDAPVTISYEVNGATRVERGNEGSLTLFSWRVLQGLNVHVTDVTASISVPAMSEVVDCVAGPPGGVEKCDLYAAGTVDSPMPTFRSTGRGVGEQVTVTVGVPSDAVAATATVKEEWNLNRAFGTSPWDVLVALAALAAGAVALWALFRRVGRDAPVEDEFIPVAGFRPVAAGVSVFRVEDGVRPGHVGTVADEHVDPIDITATLLDLAVRGHLLITELPRRPGSVPDWTLTRAPAGEDQLASFESRLLDAIAPVGGESRVSALGQTLGPALHGVQDALYDDVVARGWFDSRPDATRSNWRRIGWTGLVVAILAGVALVAFTTLGLLALVLVLLGAGLFWVADHMPRRSRRGVKLLSGMDALASLLATYPTGEMPPGREIAEISRVLPYAVVLGGKQRWLEAMVAADDETVPDEIEVPWYHAPEGWTLTELPASLTQFIHTVQGVLYSR